MHIFLIYYKINLDIQKLKNSHSLTFHYIKEKYAEKYVVITHYTNFYLNKMTAIMPIEKYILPL